MVTQAEQKLESDRTLVLRSIAIDRTLVLRPIAFDRTHPVMLGGLLESTGRWGFRVRSVEAGASGQVK